MEEGAVVRASLDVVDTVSGLGLTIETLEYHLLNSSGNIPECSGIGNSRCDKNFIYVDSKNYKFIWPPNY